MTFMPNLVFLTHPSLKISGKIQMGNSDFQISVQSLIKESCHNFRTSNDSVMKLGPVTKLDKRNTTPSEKFDDDVILANCNVIVISPMYDQFGTIWKPDSGCIVCKLNTALILLLWVKLLFFSKNADSLQEICRHQQN